MVAQLMGTKLPLLRTESSCSARATSSLPVPLSPVMSTVALELATRATRSRTALAAALCPIYDGDFWLLAKLMR